LSTVLVTGTRPFLLASSGTTPDIMRWKLSSSSRSSAAVRFGCGIGLRAGRTAGGAPGVFFASAFFFSSSASCFLNDSSPPASGWKPPNYGSAAFSSSDLPFVFFAIVVSQVPRRARIAARTDWIPVSTPSA
jgi:hypothetical protein